MAMIGDGHWKSFNIVEDIANIVGRSVNQITEYTVRVHFTLMYTLQVLPIKLYKLYNCNNGHNHRSHQDGEEGELPGDGQGGGDSLEVTSLVSLQLQLQL